MATSKSKTKKTKRTRRTFPLAVRQKAVERVTTGKESPSKVAKELGIQPSLLYFWRTKSTTTGTSAKEASKPVVEQRRKPGRPPRVKNGNGHSAHMRYMSWKEMLPVAQAVGSIEKEVVNFLGTRNFITRSQVVNLAREVETSLKKIQTAMSELEPVNRE